jgi:hypothetical protein
MKKRLYRTEREFGLIVGGVFTLLSAWWFYRGKFPNLMPYVLALGATLICLGAVYPRALVYPNRYWMKLAAVLGFISTRIVLAIVFFLLVAPIGFVKRMFGWDPLHRRSASSESYWRPYSVRQRDPRHFEKMY